MRCAPATLQPCKRKPQPQAMSGQPLRCATPQLGCCTVSSHTRLVLPFHGCLHILCSASQFAPPSLANASKHTTNGGSRCHGQLSALRYGVIMHKGDTCRISRLVGSRTCAQVHARIQRGLPPGPPTLSIPGSPPPVVAPKRPNNKRKVGAPQRRKNASQARAPQSLWSCSIVEPLQVWLAEAGSSQNAMLPA